MKQVRRTLRVGFQIVSLAACASCHPTMGACSVTLLQCRCIITAANCSCSAEQAYSAAAESACATALHACHRSGEVTIQSGMGGSWQVSRAPTSKQNSAERCLTRVRQAGLHARAGAGHQLGQEPAAAGGGPAGRAAHQRCAGHNRCRHLCQVLLLISWYDTGSTTRNTT